MHDADLLTGCLADLDWQGWDLEDYLGSHPELPDAVRCDLLVASRVRAVPRPTPSPAFRARSRANVVSFIQQDALTRGSRARRNRLERDAQPWLRRVLPPAAAAAMLLVGMTGVGAVSMNTLPETPLYPAKVAFERVQVLTAITPEQEVAVHLDTAAARLAEAAAETRGGNVAVATELLRSFDEEIAAAGRILQTESSPLSAAFKTEVQNRVADLRIERQSIVTRGGGPIASHALAETSAPHVAADETTFPIVPGSIQTEADTPPGSVAGTIGTPPDMPTQLPEIGQPQTTLPGLGVRLNRETSGSTLDGPGPSFAPAPVAPVARATGVAAASRSQVPSSLGQIQVRVPTDTLVRTLVVEAHNGDSTGALTTARQVAKNVQTVKPTTSDAVASLRKDQATLQAAIVTSPSSTRPAVQLALTAIERAVPPQTPTAVNPIQPAGDNSPGTDPQSTPGKSASDKKHDGHQPDAVRQPDPRHDPAPVAAGPKPGTSPNAPVVLVHSPSRIAAPPPQHNPITAAVTAAVTASAAGTRSS